MTRRGWTIGTAALLALLTGGLGLGDASREAAAQGGKVRRGYDLGVEEVNKAGGIKALGGAHIELVYADNQGKQDVSIGETERLIQQEKVCAIMGAWHSPSTIAG